MGNSASKSSKSKSKKNGGTSDSSTKPAFVRTDTQGSSRSMKSFHSRKSVQSDAESFRSAKSTKSAMSALSSGLESSEQQDSHQPPSELHLPTQQQDISSHDILLTPGPSILAPPVETSPADYFSAVYQGSTETTTRESVTNSSTDASTTPRPYHRRTYSSNSIINGGVINEGPSSVSNNADTEADKPTLQDNCNTNISVSENSNLTETLKSCDNASTDTADTTHSASSVNTKSSSISSTSSLAVSSTAKPEGSPSRSSIVTTTLTTPSLVNSNNNSPVSQLHTTLASPFPRGDKKLGLRTSSFASSSGGGNGITLNIDEVIQRLLDAGYRGRTTKHVCLKNNEIALICQTAREIFLAQPIVLDLLPPVKIVGDVHGQYGDLIRMFDMCGFPPSSNFLFLGDYVDRGKQSLETILLLLCYKIKYPENFFLLRGNHECANVTRVYGFYDECKRRCNIKTWKIFIDTFNTLPIAAIVAQKIFCVHGGLSPSLNNMNELRSIQRPTDVPDYGLLNDILWSDPADTENEWEDNERGVSYCFNKVAINKFLAKFGFDLVCRAHIVVEDGYEFFNDRTLVTVFSAPNYCGEFDNWGAVMSVGEDLLCSFELLKPLDSLALRQEMQRSRLEKRTMSSSSLPSVGPQSF